MRRLLLVIMGMVCAVSSTAQTSFTAVWHCTNFVSQPASILGVNLTPISSIFGITNQVLAGETITGQTDSNGVVTFTNLLAGFAYRFELDVTTSNPLQPIQRIVRTNGFPPGLTGTVAAEPYDGIQFPGNVPFAYFNTNAPIANITPLTTDINAAQHNITNAATITASSFTGSGSGLTSLPAASITGTPGRNVLYVSKSGSDSTGTRNAVMLPFLTIGAARNAAFSGDKVEIIDGIYNENGLATNKILYWQFDAGAGLAYNPAANDLTGYAAWDDRLCPNGTTNFVTGNPNCSYCCGTNTNAMAFSTGTFDDNVLYSIWYMGSTNSAGMVVMTNTNSVFVGWFGDVPYSDFTQDSPVVAAAFNVKNCKYAEIHFAGMPNAATNMQMISATVGGITSRYLLTTNLDPNEGNLPIILVDNSKGVVWSAGRTYITCDNIGQMGYCAVWCEQQFALTSEQNFYFKSTGELQAKIYCSAGYSGAPNFVSWFEVPKIEVWQAPLFGVALDCEGGKVYFNGGDKLIDHDLHECVYVQDGGATTDTGYSVLWLTCQKLSTEASSGWWIKTKQIHAGVQCQCFANVLHYEYDDTTANPLTHGGLINDGAYLNIQGGLMTVTNAVGLWVTNGGTTIIQGLRMDTSASTATNYWPVVAGGTGLEMDDCYLKAPTSPATYSIMARSSTTPTLVNTVTNQPAVAAAGAIRLVP